MLPLSRVELTPRSGFDPASWYLDLAPIAQLQRSGLEFTDPITVLIGENGVGKSTLVEAIAASWQVGFRDAQDRMWSSAPSAEDADLGRHLTYTGARPQPFGGCFLRAESMHALFGAADEQRPRASDQAFNELSHGQSFLRYVADRPVGVGLWILDEPEAALSFQSCLALIGVLGDLAAEGSQVILATHSPLLAAVPGARIWELTDGGIEYPEWADTALVRGWRSFLDAPERFLRHL
ncbi:AAA family ATPase [Rhodococcus triatomae]|uniref:Predicted ATPase n=1 Tax=Rhodococcus triatomae TaxID=300028 RepID=A0A1G7Z8D0_9NOCA|nr:AAA family ATPase [Rhodococcus triatomae]QNG18099.1 AAA family ATPase [Rhodococcus triatomae]QNG22231.1 AAA family ATPase [Rhodococcus triatomae]SDH04857.1 Predicted ATPase [Rhodococcus triatomae]